MAITKEGGHGTEGKRYLQKADEREEVNGLAAQAETEQVLEKYDERESSP